MKLGWMSGRLSAVVFAFGFLGCNQDPEDFCNSKVEEICKAVEGCCNSKSKFDMEDCRLSISQSCNGALDVEAVHAGDVVFDSGAASSCFPTIDSCDDITAQASPTDDQYKACNNMITGYRPAGAACGDSAQCAKDGGDFPVCYAGKLCAKGIVSQDECGFSLETNELRVCTQGKYCDVDDKTFAPKDPPTPQELEFSGACKDYPGKNGKCLPDGMTPIACAEGYYCQFDLADPKASTCQALKSKGQECDGGNCKSGLTCEYDNATMKQTCVAVETNGPYCFTPPTCGDNICNDPAEDSGNCPEDCGAAPGCGDGQCDFNGGEPATCPEDCCGDGFCDPGETAQICAADCG